MANTIALKRRIGSVKNTKQITKAMELVAASKMHKSRDAAHASRPYRIAATSLLARLSTMTDVEEHPLYKKRPVKTKLYIIITSNRGLAGAYNANIFRLLTKSMVADVNSGVAHKIIAVGKQGGNFVRRLQGVELLATYDMFGDHPTANDVRPLLSSVMDAYRSGAVDDVELLYTDLKSNIVQEAKNLLLLPARFDVEDADAEQVSALANATFEPSLEVVLDGVTERLLEAQLWQAMLESVASEHSMRMLAMKNATDNASELIDDLTLAFNTARQASITQELAEITGGAEAMK
jgi:F-type H+-transporting ATPase subunit gamma